MEPDASKIAALREQVRAADEEFTYAQRFHEAWKPAAADTALHERMGSSYATNTFYVIRAALRREMLLALMRIWDTHPKALKMFEIARVIEDDCVVDALADECIAARKASKIAGLDDFDDSSQEAIRRSEIRFGEEQAKILKEEVAAAVAIIGKYREGGTGRQTFDSLKRLRNERLAHRDITKVEVAEVFTAEDGQIEQFYQDTSTLIRLLKSAVHKTDYSPDETALNLARYAKLFWEGVKGERTQGHPSYRGFS